MNGTINGVSCGNCKGKHPTPDDVRKCYAGKYGVAREIMSDAEETRLIQAKERAEDEAVAQAKAARDAALTDASWSGQTVQYIGGNKQSPRYAPNSWAKVRALQNQLPNVPRLRFAIEVIDFTISPAPVVKFYRVDRPQKGKWAGRTFLSVQAGDDFYPVKKPESIESVLGAYLHNPEAALARYGREIKSCGVCGRTLTVEESRERGIGPDCAQKLGL